MLAIMGDSKNPRADPIRTLAPPASWGQSASRRPPEVSHCEAGRPHDTSRALRLRAGTRLRGRLGQHAGEAASPLSSQSASRQPGGTRLATRLLSICLRLPQLGKLIRSPIGLPPSLHFLTGSAPNNLTKSHTSVLSHLPSPGETFAWSTIAPPADHPTTTPATQPSNAQRASQAFMYPLTF